MLPLLLLLVPSLCAGAAPQEPRGAADALALVQQGAALAGSLGLERATGGPATGWVARLRANATGKLDLLAALADRPSGVYYLFIAPLLQAVTLAVQASTGPQTDYSKSRATIECPPGSGTWERLFDLELNPNDAGVHAFTFADHETKRAILVFRTSCYDYRYSQCRGDRCFMLQVQPAGNRTGGIFGDKGSLNCKLFQDEQLDYVSQAWHLAQSVLERLPGYSLILTGHSMGGLLATVTAARQPDVLQAVAFSPTPFQEVLSEQLLFSEAQIAALPAQDIVAICDPYDCGYNSLQVPDARKGSTTCIYDAIDVNQIPQACRDLKEVALTSQPSPREWWAVEECIAATHDWSSYVTRISSPRPGAFYPGSQVPMPALPSCSQEFSVFSERLVASMNAGRQASQI